MLCCVLKFFYFKSCWFARRQAKKCYCTWMKSSQYLSECAESVVPSLENLHCRYILPHVSLCQSLTRGGSWQRPTLWCRARAVSIAAVQHHPHQSFTTHCCLILAHFLHHQTRRFHRILVRPALSSLGSFDTNITGRGTASKKLAAVAKCYKPHNCWSQRDNLLDKLLLRPPLV